MLFKINKCKILGDFGIQTEQPVLEKQANLVDVKKYKEDLPNCRRECAGKSQANNENRKWKNSMTLSGK